MHAKITIGLFVTLAVVSFIAAYFLGAFPRSIGGGGCSGPWSIGTNFCTNQFSIYGARVSLQLNLSANQNLTPAIVTYGIPVYNQFSAPGACGSTTNACTQFNFNYNLDEQQFLSAIPSKYLPARGNTAVLYGRIVDLADPTQNSQGITFTIYNATCGPSPCNAGSIPRVGSGYYSLSRIGAYTIPQATIYQSPSSSTTTATSSTTSTPASTTISSTTVTTTACNNFLGIGCPAAAPTTSTQTTATSATTTSPTTTSGVVPIPTAPPYQGSIIAQLLNPLIGLLNSLGFKIGYLR